jgi:hypothetical protein
MERNMNIEEKIEYLRKKHPDFGRRVLWDVDNKGNEFCELVYPNENNPSFPITVSVSDNGCHVSVGQISQVTGNRPITVEQAASAIDDVVNDRIIFVLGYKDDDDIGSGAPFLTDLYPITGGVDDASEELDRFIQQISTPVTGFKRKLTRLKGRFIIFNFSGERRQEIIR